MYERKRRDMEVKRTDKAQMKRRLALLAAALVFVWALWQAFGYTFSWEALHMNDLTFRPGPKTFSLAAGDQHGTLNHGPYDSLTQGRYRLDLAIDSDGDNTIRIVTGNDARVEPAQMVIPAHSWTTAYEFELLDDADNLEILIDFESGSYLAIHGFDLHMACTDRVWMVLLAGLAACALYVLRRRGWLTRERARLLLIFAAAVFVASWPALRENLYTGHDSVFHLARIRNVVSGLRAGQLPVRIGGGPMNAGYGSVVSVFYPDATLYLPALLMISGTTVQFAISVFLICANLAAAVSMYVCARRIYGDENVSVCASVFYVLATYRLTDVYTRAAFGEMAAMAVLPLFVLGLWEILVGDKNRWLLLTFSATAIFQSHILSTVLCAVCAVLACALGARRLVRDGRWAALAKAALATLLLNLFTLVPLLTYMAEGIETGVLQMQCASNTNEVVELFVSDVTFARDIGLALLLGVVLSVYALCGRRGGKEKTAWFFLLLGVLTAVMTTDYFPWAWLEEKTRGASDYLQFPWRLMMFTDVFLALACGYGVLCLTPERKDILRILVLFVCIAGAFEQLSWLSVTGVSQLDYWKTNEKGVSSYYEYTIPGSDLSAALAQQEPVVSGGITMEDYRKSGTQITAQVDAQTDAQIVFPLFGYTGYRAALNGREMNWTRAENNRIKVDLPAGAQGELEIRFVGRASWHIAEAVSLCTLLGLLGLCLYRRRRTRAAGARKSLQM